MKHVELRDLCGIRNQTLCQVLRDLTEKGTLVNEPEGYRLGDRSSSRPRLVAENEADAFASS